MGVELGHVVGGRTRPELAGGRVVRTYVQQDRHRQGFDEVNALKWNNATAKLKKVYESVVNPQ